MGTKGRFLVGPRDCAPASRAHGSSGRWCGSGESAFSEDISLAWANLVLNYFVPFFAVVLVPWM